MVLMAFGHFAMAVQSMLFPALLLLIFGGGLFKSNTTAQVGLLYKPGDPARTMLGGTPPTAPEQAAFVDQILLPLISVKE